VGGGSWEIRGKFNGWKAHKQYENKEQIA